MDTIRQRDLDPLKNAKNKNITLKPEKKVNPSQAYFWTKEWQAGEQEAEEDIQKGRLKKFRNIKGLMKDLKG